MVRWTASPLSFGLSGSAAVKLAPPDLGKPDTRRAERAPRLELQPSSVTSGSCPSGEEGLGAPDLTPWIVDYLTGPVSPGDAISSSKPRRRILFQMETCLELSLANGSRS